MKIAVVENEEKIFKYIRNISLNIKNLQKKE